MIFDTEIFLYGSLFVAMLLMIEGGYYLFRSINEDPERAVNRRLRMLAKGEDSRTTLRKLRREGRDYISALLVHLMPGTERVILQAGMTMSLARMVFIMVGLWAVTYALIELQTPTGLIVNILISTFVGVGLPYFYIKRRRSKRLKQLTIQLPDALDLIVRSLRAGHPISAALDLVAKEMPDPIGTEFGLVVDEMTFGLDFNEALTNLAKRAPVDDLRFVIVSVQIQYMVGGNLAEILENLSHVVRARFQMFAKIRAISAEGRLSGAIVGLLPIIVAILVQLQAPDYFTAVMGEPLFWPLIALSFMLMALGQITIYRMVNFRF
jgi:tight adherence protein B